VVVHHVEVDQLGATVPGPAHLIGKASEVRREDRRRPDHPVVQRREKPQRHSSTWRKIGAFHYALFYKNVCGAA
jgi:hypothetical protein